MGIMCQNFHNEDESRKRQIKIKTHPSLFYRSSPGKGYLIFDAWRSTWVQNILGLFLLSESLCVDSQVTVCAHSVKTLICLSNKT